MSARATAITTRGHLACNCCAREASHAQEATGCDTAVRELYVYSAPRVEDTAATSCSVARHKYDVYGNGERRRR